MNFKNNIIFKNTFYLALIQVFNYVLPLLTIPYLLKIFGINNFGIFSLAQLLISYLIVITDYGFNISATRQVSLNKDNPTELNRIFTGVIVSKLILATICIIIGIFLIYLLPVFAKNKNIFLISLGAILGQVFFPIWLFQGIEKMKQIALFSSIIKILLALSIFTFISQKDQLDTISWLYVFNALILGFFSFAYSIFVLKIQIVQIKTKYVIELIKDGFDIFLTSFFSSILVNGGLMVLGFFHSEYLVGIYSSVDKLVKAFVSLVSTFNQSLFPRIANTFSVNKKQAIGLIYKYAKILLLFLFICFAMSFFLSKFFLNIFYGKQLVKYSYILVCLSFWVLNSFANNFIGIQFLVASGNGRYYRKAFIFSGIITLVSFFGIKYLAIDGVLISTLFSELILTIAMLYFIKKYKLLNVS